MARRCELSILYAILCGAIQGACEFLPVSSSGHLALFHTLFGDGFGSAELGLDVLLHLGTLVAVVVSYRRDVRAIVCAFFSAVGKILRGGFKWRDASSDEKTAILIIAATVPLAAAALVKDKVEALSAYPKFVGAMLIVNGAMLILGTLIKPRGNEIQSLGAKGALGVGTFQLLACLPGLSRSGSTITGGCVFGLSREEAVRFSFLMSIPAIVGANVSGVPDMIKYGVGTDILPSAAGFITAAAVGLIAIKVIKRAAKNKSFNFFGIYCIISGLVTVLG